MERRVYKTTFNNELLLKLRQSCQNNFRANKQLCKRLDISVADLVKAQYNNAKTINEVNNLEARLLISKLSGFQRDSDAVADNLKGYDENWKNDFYRS